MAEVSTMMSFADAGVVLFRRICPRYKHVYVESKDYGNEVVITLCGKHMERVTFYVIPAQMVIDVGIVGTLCSIAISREVLFRKFSL